MINGDLVRFKDSENATYVVESYDGQTCLLHIIGSTGYASGRYTEKGIREFGIIESEFINWRDEL